MRPAMHEEGWEGRLTNDTGIHIGWADSGAYRATQGLGVPREAHHE